MTALDVLCDAAIREAMTVDFAASSAGAP